jgi:hypothetical protein
MEKIEQLEKEMARLSLAVRIGLAAVIIGSVTRAYTTLCRADQFGSIFSDLLGEKSLPALTQFFLNFATPLTVGIGAISLAAVVALFTRPKAVWSIPFGVCAAAGCIIVSELSLIAFQSPFLQLVTAISE